MDLFRRLFSKNELSENSKNSAKNVNNTDYKTAEINNHLWITENLNIDHYSNGDVIPQAKSFATWEKYSKKCVGCWCYHNNDVANGEKYGKLYNWYAINDPRGITQTGYHVPTKSEWELLRDFLGGKENAGIYLKSNSEWTRGSINRLNLNSSLFTGLPASARSSKGEFGEIGGGAFFWSASELDSEFAYYFTLNYNDDTFYCYNDNKTTGMSIRCIKNSEQNYDALSSSDIKQFEKEGNTFQTIKIGKSLWMGKNLNVSNYANGDPIFEAKSDIEWYNACENQKGAWCYYLNDDIIGKTSGKLYNWFAINDPRGLAPNGWHISDESNWEELILNVEDKSRSQYVKHYQSNFINNFRANPTGWRKGRGEFKNGNDRVYWTSKIDFGLNAIAYDIDEYNETIKRHVWDVASGAACRCIKD